MLLGKDFAEIKRNQEIVGGDCAKMKITEIDFSK